MIFPRNVYRRAADSRKLMARDKNSIIIQLFVIGNIICFFVLRFIFNTFLGLATSWALLAQLVLFIILGIFIFRVVIFKEDEKMQEYHDAQSDSFARYLHVRKDNLSEITVNNNSVYAFEYTNGCVMATIRFRFGSNDNTTANSTRMVLETIYGLCGFYNFMFRTDTMTEVFSHSLEYKKHLRQINEIQNKKLSLHLRNISQACLNDTANNSNVDVLYLTVMSKIPGDKEQLESLLSAIVKCIYENRTCFRSMEFLDINSLLEFYREFYNIEAIDLAMMKAIDISSSLNQDFNKLVQVYSLNSADGKTFKVQKDDRRFNTKEREL